MLLQILEKQPSITRVIFAKQVTNSLNNKYWYHPLTYETHTGSFRHNAIKIANLMNTIDQPTTNFKYNYLDFYCNEETPIDLQLYGFIEKANYYDHIKQKKFKIS